MGSQTDLEATARELVSPGRGILAADESSPTIKKRFDGIGLESTEDNRRAYRELLFTTKGIGEFVSGVILYDETIRQSASDGRPFTEILQGQNVIPGIKVDKGAKPLPFHPGESVTEGLDGLRDRLGEYSEMGARFAKWRAVITVVDPVASDYCLDANAQALARYAALCQEAGLVPIVEPEVLMDADNTIEQCAAVTTRALSALFGELATAGVALEGTLLKPNMVVPGKKCPEQVSVERVAAETLKVLKRTVPAALPGIVFLSGGQADEDATARLSAMNAMGGGPWELSFSFARALQAPALKTWAGDPANVDAAQRAFYHRAKLNSAARTGSYRPEMENAA